MFNNYLWGRFVEQKLKLSYSFRCDLIYNNRWYNFDHFFHVLGTSQLAYVHFFVYFLNQAEIKIAITFWKVKLNNLK